MQQKSKRQKVSGEKLQWLYGRGRVKVHSVTGDATCQNKVEITKNKICLNLQTVSELKIQAVLFGRVSKLT